ncbi:amino acid adenylation domain-containing protein [Burkholderia gladioli]|uniref:non-ribosomal peptide synthetase n=1 Tax=Burkholderia gladioli TaxID=28095 RepID=UPI001C24B712|nr:non-ribosomal peptide synthetase [Burkholderia gladioli]MBU9213786.1 amino acid adenylation domain-containing protein [Burkholderia gladioli]
MNAMISEVIRAYREGKLTTADLAGELRRGAEDGADCALSEGQRGIWALQALHEDRGAYNVPLCFAVRELRMDALRQALRVLAQRYPSLGAAIRVIDGEPRCIQPAVATLEPVVSTLAEALGAEAAAADEAAILAWLNRQAREPFALEDGPLCRVQVLELDGWRSARPAGEGRFDATWTIVALHVHHLVLDGQSLLLLVGTLFDTYHALVGGTRPAPGRALAASEAFADFVAEERALLAGEEGARRLAYWRRQLEGLPAALALPSMPNPGAAEPGPGVHALSLDAARAARVAAFAAQRNLSASALFLGLFTLLLHRHTGEPDIVVGMPVDARPPGRYRDTLGLFINMLPLRTRLAGEESMATLLERVQRQLVDAIAMQYPFGALVRELGLQGARDSAPLYRIAFMYQDFLGGLKVGEGVEPIGEIRQAGEYELVLEVVEAGPAGYTLNWKYDGARHGAPAVQAMARHYLALLDALLADASARLADCPMLPPDEVAWLLARGQGPQGRLPAERHVHEWIDARAARAPRAIALSCGDRSLDYARLVRDSDALAARLRRHGIGAGQAVAVRLERSIELVVSLLAVWKTGAAYVPLDPTYPDDWTEAILRDCRPAALLTQAALAAGTEALMRRVAGAADDAGQAASMSGAQAAGPVAIVIDAPEHDAAAAPRIASRDGAGLPPGLAYLIYTSGSTGTPKGVMVTHAALLNFLASMARRPGLDEHDTLLAVTTCCFDISILELFLPLVCGARCVICDSATARDGARLRELVDSSGATVMQATPSSWAMLCHAGWSNPRRLRVLCGGEPLPDTLKTQLLAFGGEVWNLYGPTETTIWSMLAPVTAERATSIGTPIDNTRVRIVDAYGNLQPIGVPGELCIAGDGLAAGYLNRPAETAARFVDGWPRALAGGERCYRTGDLARWREDGEIEHLGRIDFQVKIRGHRIEIEDVERHLARHPAIGAAAVVARRQAGGDQLVAYHVPRDADGAHDVPGAAELREYLAARLPDYMIPALFQPIDALPVTHNGKLDRKALAGRGVRLRVAAAGQTPAAGGGASDRRAEVARIEARLLTICRDVLGVDDIARDDGFFEAGGNSLSVALMAARVGAEFGIAAPGAGAFFRYPNVAALAAHLAERLRRQDDGEGGAAADEDADGRAHGGAGAARAAGARRAGAEGEARDELDDAIAIIGISCQFPGAIDHRAFWRNLREGRSGARFYSDQELREAGVPDALIRNRHYVPMQQTIEGKDLFDRSFFRLTTKDAQLMDPQFRLLLQHAWKVIEDAGYTRDQLADAGVYMSASNSYYQAMLRAAGNIDASDEYQAWLLAQGGTIPTRISYELGLTGPSLFVHSNCSSGLVSLSVAAKSLLQGESRYALVGAATVLPEAGIGYLHQPGLNLSSDGRCRTFDEDADGLTSGEGVAVLLVKRAREAIEDGDAVYAVLRGIAVNNDGADKVGFYAPSVGGQSEVIRKVLDATGIHPETIGYVEAHGTGTRLGDPVEVAALTEAYRRHTSRTGFCAIGSVKPNIGHLDTVAGLSGCIKVALSLRHGEIPPSIHYRKPNREIDFERSPFRVVDRLTPWPAVASGLPRRAALSSFGIGGTNVHLILEAREPAGQRASDTASAAASRLVVLSARGEERLRAQAAQLLAFLEQEAGALPDFDALAHTLQTGREAMRHRLALVVDGHDALAAALAGFLRGTPDAASCFAGESGQDATLSALFDDDAAGHALVAAWCAEGKLAKVAALWANGARIDWRRLYAGRAPRRVSLPTYPFAPEACPAAPRREPRSRPAGHDGRDEPRREAAPDAPRLHPLMHEEHVDGALTRFTATYSGEEFFLTDHLIRGKRILPGVAYLEMARLAAVRSQGDVAVSLHDVVWMAPIVVDAPCRVELRLDGAQATGSTGDAARVMRFAVASGAGEAGRTNSQGTIRVVPGAFEAVAAIDLAALLARCPREIPAQRFYHFLDSGGGQYGPSFRSVTALHLGEREVLARLALPASAGAPEAFVLHPSMMDAAFQIADSLVLQPRANGGCLPFFVKSLEMRRRPGREAWVHVRLAGGDGRVARYDIDLIDPDGTVCVSMREFSARAEAADGASEPNRYRAAVWQSGEPRDEREADAGAMVAGRHRGERDAPRVAVLEAAPRLSDELRRLGIDASWLPEGDDARHRPALRDLARDQAATQAEGRPRDLLVLADARQAPADDTLADWLGHDAAATGRRALVLVAGLAEASAERVAALVERERHGHAAEVRHEADGTRRVRGWIDAAVPRWLLETDALRPGGCYWIAGANGALGASLACHLLTVERVTVVLSDAQPPEPAIVEAIERHRGEGARLVCLTGDAGRDAADLAARIRDRHGRIDGVLHCAHDPAGASSRDTLAALAAIDAATRADALDFLAACAAPIGASVGETRVDDDACGEHRVGLVARFVDARQARVQAGIGFGRTVSVTAGAPLPWPGRTPLLRAGGIASQPALAVVQALYHALGSEQVALAVDWHRPGVAAAAVLPGASSAASSIVSPMVSPATAPAPQAMPAAGPLPAAKPAPARQADPDRIAACLKDVIAEVIRSAADEIDASQPFGDYGLDSLSLTSVSNRLNERYGLDASPTGALNPTLFFEHGSVQRMAAYLAAHHAACFAAAETDQAAEVLAPAVEAVLPGTDDGQAGLHHDIEARAWPARRDASPPAAGHGAPERDGGAATPAGDGSPPASAARRLADAGTVDADADAVAIIGISGRFPGARDVAEFERNLFEGRDCVGEIPAERWNWRDYLDDPQQQGDKTSSKWGGFIDGIAEFDPLFFNLSPKEAYLLDPAHRLLLMHAWWAIEDAGYNPVALAGSRTALFAGVAQSGYADLRREAGEGIEGNSFLGVVPSIALNRISHFLDLHGPSEPVETACSSSLVAMHRAVVSLRCGDADLALVGGVQTILSPHAHIGFGKAGMLAGDGRCKTFSDRADGFVRGEGIGMLFLKRLADARRDGDPVYGVIRGSAVNHDGRSNSLTAPNPAAQRDVIVEAHERAGSDPRRVGYIEAHGTGTKLGDPIEINALNQAFDALLRAQGEPGASFVPGACAIGSVKSNVGHLELAAGVSGVIKVLLQMARGQWVKSLHCETLNPYIQFDGGPFRVVGANAAWPRPLDRHGRELPRRAGVSSFGIGGVNAHVVIEEYREDGVRDAAEDGRPAAVLLSARDPERLIEQVRTLLAFLRAAPARPRLADLAYTLQVGREPMRERLGFVVGSLAELEARLAACVDGIPDAPGVYRGSVRPARGARPPEADGLERLVGIWLAGHKHEALLGAWIKGTRIDWAQLHPAGSPAAPRRVHLPGYPFAREHYWISETAAASPVSPASRPVGAAPAPHPLRRDAGHAGRFVLELDGGEAFLADHRVNGHRMLPGVMHLEIAREAARLSFGLGDAIRIRNLGWVRPVVAGDGPLRLSIELDRSDAPETAWRICGQDRLGERVIHSEGAVGRAALAEADRRLDLDALRASFAAAEAVDPAVWYEGFARAGIDYGPSHRGLERCLVGPAGVLARVRLPEAERAAARPFVLHPGLLDAVLQAAIGLRGTARADEVPRGTPYLPFALDTVDILGACDEAAWAWLRPSAARGDAAKAASQCIDIDVCDDAGRILVRLRGLSSRPLARRPAADAAQACAAPIAARAPSAELPDTAPAAIISADAELGLLARTATWSEPADAQRLVEAANRPAPGTRLFVLGGTEAERQAIAAAHAACEFAPGEDAGDGRAALDALRRRLDDGTALAHLIWIAPPEPAAARGDALVAAQGHGVLQLFRIVKLLLAAGYGAKSLDWTVVTRETHATSGADLPRPAHAGVHGLVGSMAKEYRNWRVRVLDMPAAEDWPVEAMLSARFDPDGNALAYRHHRWLARELVAIDLPEPRACAMKTGGVYVVIGGAGGIGEVWSRWMMARYRARIVWIGRREEDASMRARRERLACFGTPPVYLRADAADRDSLAAARERIAALRWDGQALPTSGVIHSAIVLADASLATMDEARFLAAWRAKADVSVRLAEVFGDDPLDFMLFFSSITSFGKTAGQSNYAAGCAFKDAFAAHLGRTLAYPVKVMNWGYWGSVGVVSEASYRERMTQAGFGSIEPEEGMQALERLLASRFAQVAVLKTLKPNLLGDARADRLDHYPGRDWPEGKAAPATAALQAALAARADHWQAQAASLEVTNPELETLIARGLLAGMLPCIEAAAPVAARHAKWFEESVSMLRGFGYLAPHAGGADARLSLSDAGRRAATGVWDDWARASLGWVEDDYRRVPMRLAEVCLRALPELLAGTRRATEVMFPGSSMALVEGLYKNNRKADLFNEVVHDAVLAHGRVLGRELDIIEVGAGTGGTTDGLLRKLAAQGVPVREYRYTDLSHAFLLHAREQYAPRAPFLSTGIFDVDRPIGPQGVPVGRYDLAIATNVLHATQDIRRALRNVKATLRAGGLLVLNELSLKSLFSHVTFGLLDGWWMYRDAELRIPGSPGIDMATWRRVLVEEGFEYVVFPAPALHAHGQQVVIAQSDGVVRQAREGTAPARMAAAAPAAASTASTSASAPEAVARSRRSPAAASVDAGIAAATATAPTPAPVTSEPAKHPASTVDTAGAGDIVHTTEGMHGYLRDLLSRVLKLPAERIEIDAPFASYGTDSIMAMALIAELEKDLGSLPKTLFFEHETIEELAAYLLEREAPALPDLPVVAQPATDSPASAVDGDEADQAAGGVPAAVSVEAGARVHTTEGMHDYLRDLLSRVLKLPAERIEIDAPFASYGTDSIMAMALIAELEKDLGSLPKTLFFEHETIEELAAYLLERDASALPDLPAVAQPAAGGVPAPADVEPGAPAHTTEGMHDYLRDLLSRVLKLPAERIEIDAPFASYGTDSIMAMALIAELEKDLGSLPKTLFFEHETIEELAAYLLERQAQEKECHASNV